MPSLPGCHGGVQQLLAPIASVAMRATALLNQPNSIWKIEEALWTVLMGRIGDCRWMYRPAEVFQGS